MLDKSSIARTLREMGQLLELKGENPFKIRAYENGARALEELAEELEPVIAEDRLTQIPGIGEALAKKVAELYRTERLEALERLRAEVPQQLLELLRIPDLGPRKIAALHAALGIASLADLREACLAGRVREVKGFGERTERKILEGIQRLEASGRRRLLSEALQVGERLLAHLRACPAALHCDLAGSARRRRETVGDLDLVAASTTPAVLAQHFAAFPGAEEVLARGDTKVTLRLTGGLQVDLRIVPPDDYAALLHHFTGSKAHHVKLRGLAREHGLTLSEWGLQRLDGGPKLPVGEEADIYRALGMQAIPPELREDQGEIEAALAGTLPQDLVRAEDVRGMVHCHTDWSDGRASIEEMARAAEALGMEYLTITDHSQSAGYAGGLSVERLERQWEEIASVQEKVGIRLLRGAEADILEDGSLDYPDGVLERLEVVVASVHSRMKLDVDRMTRRMVRAMELPFFKIWGHALGRLLLEREPFACRMEEVLDAVARSRAAIEVSGDPRRLEMEPRHLRLARERGIRFVLSTDAHEVAGFGFLELAAATARRGWVRRGEVLNVLSSAEFARAVQPAG
jgi:DNA polymerase (family X)